MPIDLSHPSTRTFGTFPLTGQELTNAIETAIRAGYRAFDTAQMYNNEADVGNALAQANVDRSELFITTKVHPDNFSKTLFLTSVEQSLQKLQLQYVDLLMLHWPPTKARDEDIITVIKLLNSAFEAGYCRHIGISNFNCHMMQVAKQNSQAPLFCNQVEFHPLLNQFTLLQGAQELDIPLSAYCSNARGKVLDEPLLVDLGNKYQKSAVQVALRWALQHGVSLNTMSTKAKNIEANFDIMDFDISQKDMSLIDKLAKQGEYRIVHEGIVPWAPKWD